MTTGKNRFKVRWKDGKSNVGKLTALHGGSVVTDLRNLEPGEIWYYTDSDAEDLEASGLVEVLGQYSLIKKQGFRSNQELLRKVIED